MPKSRCFRWLLPLLIAVLPPVCQSYAGQIIIDSFASPAAGQSFFVADGGIPGGSNPVLLQQSGDGIVGGQRDVWVGVQGAASTLSAAGLIGRHDGLFQLATFGTPGAMAVLQYDGLDEETGEVLNDASALGPVDLTDGGTNIGFVLAFWSVDAGDDSQLGLAIQVVGDDGTATHVSSIPQSYGYTEWVAPFSQFTNASQLSAARSITVELNGTSGIVPNVDYQLDSIVVIPNPVPEPSGLVLLAGLATLALLAGFRRLLG